MSNNASLLNPGAAGFVFDHAQLHQNMYSAIPQSVGFSVVPYLLDPAIGVNIPAGTWNNNHAQAHADFASAFPAITLPSTVSINDINLTQGQDAWWAFSNKMAHDIANTVLPTG
jgi:hypothetical protein